MRSFVSGVVEESVSRQESARRCGGGRDKREFMHIPYLIWNIWDRFGFRPGYLLCSCFLCGVRWFTLCCFHADKTQNPEIQFPKPSFAIPVPCGVIWVGKVTLVCVLQFQISKKTLALLYTIKVEKHQQGNNQHYCMKCFFTVLPFLLSSLCVFFQFQIQFYFG